MCLWFLPTTAWAGAFWTGDWGLDPSRSDDPTQAIERAFVGPALTGQAARGYSPDGGDVDMDAARRTLLYELVGMLGVSGRVTFVQSDAGTIQLGFGDGVAHTVTPGKKWLKIRTDTGRKVRLRIYDLGDQLIVERRVDAGVVTETFLAAPVENELVVVVRIDGSQLDPGVEFRRIYRAL